MSWAYVRMEARHRKLVRELLAGREDDAAQELVYAIDDAEDDMRRRLKEQRKVGRRERLAEEGVRVRHARYDLRDRILAAFERHTNERVGLKADGHRESSLANNERRWVMQYAYNLAAGQPEVEDGATLRAEKREARGAELRACWEHLGRPVVEGYDGYGNEVYSEA